MKTDINGCSACKPGEEYYEYFYNRSLRKKLIQYDYRTDDGKLFSTVAVNLKTARQKRDKWLEEVTCQ